MSSQTFSKYIKHSISFIDLDKFHWFVSTEMYKQEKMKRERKALHAQWFEKYYRSKKEKFNLPHTKF